MLSTLLAYIVAITIAIATGVTTFSDLWYRDTKDQTSLHVFDFSLDQPSNPARKFGVDHVAIPAA